MVDGPANTFDSDVAKVRLVLIRELETISVYEALARSAQAPEARAFFEHLAQEEKEHVPEATYLLRKLDAGQNADFEKSFSEAHFLGQAASTSAAGVGDRSSPGGAAAHVAGPANANANQDVTGQPFIPEDYRLPSDPHRAIYAIPAPPSATAGSFTVGPLKPPR